MEKLIIDGTNTSPQVILDAGEGVLELSGRSYPDDAVTFFEPVYQWITDYAKNPSENTVLNIKLSYFNTASAKIILDILTEFEEMTTDVHKVLVRWHYTDDDEDMLEAGKEYSVIVDIPFEMVVYDDS
jgi:hypothetical protein